MDVMELLLGGKSTVQPTAEYKIKRLSKELGGDVVFTLHALTFDEVADIKKRDADALTVHIVLEGTSSPNLRDKALMKAYGAATPVDLLKKMLLAGEIEDISRAIERLSGFRTSTIEEVKKK